jgi:segregation and condensation protein B
MSGNAFKAPSPRFDEPDVDAAMQAAAALARGVRTAEALIFASAAPLADAEIERAMPAGVAVNEVMAILESHYARRGVNLVRIAGCWRFQTAPDLAAHLAGSESEQRKLSRAAMEVLAIIAYHQPVTRAEIEELRGVATARGTLDTLLQTGWIRLRGRRRTPGRPVTYGTTPAFLVHFSLDAISDLPGLDELERAGLFDGRMPKGLAVPLPSDDPALAEGEDPLEPDFLDALAEERANAAEEPLADDDQTALGAEDQPLDPLDGDGDRP